MTRIAENTLAHYGVKGMKWGVRRDRPTGSISVVGTSGVRKTLSFDAEKVKIVDGAPTGSRRHVKKVVKALDEAKADVKRVDQMSEDARTAFMAKTKPPHQLTNTEMRALLERVRLEDEYRRLMARPVPVRPPTRAAKTRKFVTDLVGEIAKDQTKRVAKTLATQGTNKIAKRAGLDLEPKKDKDKKKKDNAA